MPSVARLVQSLESVFLGGIIGECVVTIKNNNAHIKAMDMTSSVYAQTDAPFEHADDTIGFGDVSLLVKYLKSYASANMDFVRNDNVMTIKPENGGVLKYLLSQVDLVPTYNGEWEESGVDPIAMAVEAASCKAVIKEESVKEFLKLMSLFKPNGVTVTLSKRGKVTLHGGNTTQHQFNVVIGESAEAVEPAQIKLYGNNITAVLTAVDFTDPVNMYFVNGEIAIVTENAAWVLRPLSSEAGEE